MKTNFFTLVAIIAIFSVSSCNSSKEQVFSGVVVDATMNNIMLATNTGDTIDISTMDSDPTNIPGVLINDTIDVVCRNVDIDEVNILKAEKLTITGHSPYFYIQGAWVQPNPINESEKEGFVLKSDGSAESINMATLQFKEWNLLDRELMLTSESIGNGITINSIDTLTVIKIDADSLILSHNGYVIWELGRDAVLSK